MTAGRQAQQRRDAVEISQAAEGENPVCPYCEADLPEIKAKRIDRGWLKITEKYVYFCPQCKRLLGVAQSAWWP